jgi:hypothetical protein
MGTKQDLVRVSAADARERTLIPEERMQAPRLAAQDLRQGRSIELECIRA